MPLRPIIFWGGTGQARVLNECIAKRFKLMALFDNDEQVSSPIPNAPLAHGREGFLKWRASNRLPGIGFLVAIGGDRGADRLEIHDFLVDQGLNPITAIHTKAFVALDAEIGASCQILAHATICVNAVLGRETIVNTAASVDHDCHLGNGVHIAPGARLGGNVRVGDCSMVGIGAMVLPSITIGANVVIGAGSVVVRDIPSDCVAYGSPARVVRRRPSQAAAG